MRATYVLKSDYSLWQPFFWSKISRPSTNSVWQHVPEPTVEGLDLKALEDCFAAAPAPGASSSKSGTQAVTSLGAKPPPTTLLGHHKANQIGQCRFLDLFQWP